MWQLYERSTDPPLHTPTHPRPVLTGGQGLRASFAEITLNTYSVVAIVEGVINLRSLREAAGLTQVQLADQLGWEQGRVSRAEHQSDWRLVSLIAYLQALGADAELVVHLPDGQTITQRLTGRGRL